MACTSPRASFRPASMATTSMDDPRSVSSPDKSRQHEYRIGLDHPPGAYWYHPHLHGSTAIQVGSGMAGALIIKGEIDQVPEIAAAAERVFVFQSPITDAAGMLESFTQVADSPATEGPFLINGVRRPRIVMRRGEVQNWHFINAAIFNFVNLSLDAHALNVYSHDGNPRRNMLTIAPGAAGWRRARAGQSRQRPGPGRRTGHLLFAHAAIPDGHAARRPGRGHAGRSRRRRSTAADDVAERTAPVPASLAPITDEELASAGGLKRNIVMRTVFNDNERPITDPPASSIVHPGRRIGGLGVSDRQDHACQQGIRHPIMRASPPRGPTPTPTGSCSRRASPSRRRLRR